MIFMREWKRNIKSLLVWSTVLGGLVLLTLSVFPQFAEQQKEMTKLLESLPKSMVKAFGMDQLNIGNFMGYYGIRVYMMTTLLGSIYATILGANIVAKEESEKTIEFLLSKPLTRSRIITEKWLVVVVNILALNAAAVLSSLFGFHIAKGHEVSIKTFVLLTIATILLHVTFGAVAFLLSTMMRKTRNTLSISLGLVLVAYFLHIMSGISEDLEFLKYFTPFKYVDAAPIINNEQLEPLYVFIMAAVILFSVAMSYVVYKKKDIVV
ncbi:ABC transporter permease subunit [Anoxybacteroides amylolyticum]|uniref:ABC-2 transporter family protein n=1 Tax=Anoxybacteroides amylolyticum TaxID=294699 RepID=A0A161HUG7_9BACL|nr:ABC transporter permease subunit [Anoxybacillus amylolyticus]ANB60984.1 ABC-2 transporter family protein [Anoxybacillus amylolyticus]